MNSPGRRGEGGDAGGELATEACGGATGSNVGSDLEKAIAQVSEGIR